MHGEIGNVAGQIWHALDNKGADTQERAASG